MFNSNNFIIYKYKQILTEFIGTCRPISLFQFLSNIDRTIALALHFELKKSFRRAHVPKLQKVKLRRPLERTGKKDRLNLEKLRGSVRFGGRQLFLRVLFHVSLFLPSIAQGISVKLSISLIHFTNEEIVPIRQR